MAMPDYPLTSGGVIQRSLLWIVALLIAAIGSWLVNTLTRAEDRDELLLRELSSLRTSVATLTARVDTLPDRNSMIQIQANLERSKANEERVRELERRMNTIAKRLHQKLGIDE